jgi:ATP-binding cassette subfamily B protein
LISPASRAHTDASDLYLRAFRFVAPHVRRLGLVLAVSMVATLLSLSQPYFLKLLIDDALLSRNLTMLIGISAGLFGVSVVSLLLNAFSGYRYVQVSAEALFDMRLAVFRHLQKLSPRFYARTAMGDILSRLNNDVSEIQRVATDTLLSIVTNIILLVGTVALLLMLEPRLFLLSIALLPPSIWVLRHYRIRVNEKNRGLRESSAAIGSFLVEAFLGMRQTVASRQEERAAESFRKKNDRFIERLLDLQITNYLASGIPGMLLSLSTLAVFVAGGYLVLQGSFTMGSFVAFTAYQARLLSPIQNLMGLYLNLQAARASLERVFYLLEQKPEVVERDDATVLQQARGDVTFRSVVLSYDREGPVLDGVDFQVPAGSTYALVGPSGVGKSTIADLLLRRIDPDEGSVRLDGHDLRELTLASLRGQISVVEQDTFLWNATIAENIRYGNPQASREEVEEAARTAMLHDFISGLPDGYETEVGERGLQLSSGQRQRISIARTVLQKPTVLVLDEVTSALDGKAEQGLIDTLSKAMLGRTTLILSHRLGIVSMAERVLVLDGGTIVEEGSVRELLRREGAFRKLFASEATVESPH